MTNNKFFEFVADKKKNTLTVRREFAAGRQLVWDAYTRSELLDQWFAPKPMTTKTGHMDFRPGGYWLYAMVEPEGREHWGRSDYQTITPIDNYTALDGFCDENGILNPDLPRASWSVTFSDYNQTHTLVETVVTYNTLSDLEMVVQMGMEEGMLLTLQSLDEFLLRYNP